MILLFVLVVAFAVFRLAGLVAVPAFDSWPSALRVALVPMFLLTASAHWGKGRNDLVRMMPPVFPQPELLVTLTGVLEIVGAVGLLSRVTAPAASVGLAMLLVALFPANVRAAKRGLMIRGRPATALPLRTALQMIFIAAVLVAGWYGR